ncbi:tRNA 2-selenouridine synthase [Cyclobacterium lianum]|uniref:tRNA 2-selenouridine synthase n=1 Tax=Cyclobacterium lianum TaxID=388280 RepID=A0A1M7K8A7_9BACT|nr:tRNA 2-selenouridine(34) synthase MnmH [Cyclobacterium lianum]SHM61421.1 tRNA 2-selenouridine synthase [Cyclobacterium lianum]
MELIDVKEFLDLRREGFPVLDTRSPAEFSAGHIPGAINLSLFTNEERAAVGTIYKDKGQKPAIKTGLSFVGPKMISFIERAEALGSGELLVHCWRGGMRSQSMAWLLELYGFHIRVLKGGYKAFRNAMLTYFENPPELKILSGETGSMKTRLLQEMDALGAQVVDLEKLAHHQGSSFGNQMSTGQPTTEQFQNDIFEAFLSKSQNGPIWLEDESFSIGKVGLIEPLYKTMQLAPHYVVALPKEQRIAVLVEAYGSIPREGLAAATRQISKKLGKDQTEKAVAYIQAGRLEQAVAIILRYYDKAYRIGIQKKASRIAGTFPFESHEIRKLARRLANQR